MNKIKTFFRVLFESLNPARAKKYFLGFSIGKLFGFLFVTITLAWLFFLYLVPTFIYLRIRTDKSIHQKVAEYYKKSLLGVKNIVQEIPFESIKVDFDNKQVKVLGLNQPYVIDLFVDKSCNINTWQKPFFKHTEKALYILCGSQNWLNTISDKEIDEKRPAFGVLIDTDQRVASVETAISRTPGYVDIILTSDYLSIGYLQNEFTGAYKEEKIVFAESLELDNQEDQVVEPLLENVSKDIILKTLDTFVSVSDEYILSWFINLMHEIFYITVMFIAPILTPFAILASIIPSSTFALFFNILGLWVIAALIGIALAYVFKGTSKDFASNLKLAALAVTSVILYKLLIVLFFGAIFAFAKVSIPYMFTILYWLLLKSSVTLVAVFGIMLWLKYLSYQELQNLDDHKVNVNK